MQINLQEKIMNLWNIITCHRDIVECSANAHFKGEGIYNCVEYPSFFAECPPFNDELK